MKLILTPSVTMEGGHHSLRKRRDTVEAMYELLPADGQRAIRQTLKSLAVTSLAAPPGTMLLFTLLVGGLASLLGLSGSEFMLEFFGAAAGPITMLQLYLVLVVGLLAVLCFFPSRECVGASTSLLAFRLSSKILNLARMWSLTASCMIRLPRPSVSSGFCLVGWNHPETSNAAYLAGDCPQLE